jgi:hypothetical protein
VVENFIYYLTGNRFTQEDAIIQHSKLLEQDLLEGCNVCKTLGDVSLNDVYMSM